MEPSAVDVRSARDADRPRISQLLGEAFTHSTAPLADPETLSLDGRYVADVDGVIAASVLASPCGQLFGDREVTSSAVRGVCVASEHRGTGIGTRLLSKVLGEQHTAGVGISSLYPSLVGPYRRLGYQIAGLQHVARTSVGSFRKQRGGPQVVPWSGDVAELRACYDTFVRGVDGPLVRTDAWWHEKVLATGSKARRYLHCVREDGLVTGYLAWAKSPATGPLAYAYDVDVVDRAWSTPHAAAVLGSWMLGHRGLGVDATWSTLPGDPWLDAIDADPVLGTTRPWMVRIVSIVVALSSRGYPADVDADVVLDVTDDVVPGNAGLWRLTVSGGSAHVERVSTSPADALRLDIRALATVYTGHASVASLRQRGLLDGPPSAQRALEACLPPSGAWLAEAF